MSSSHMIWIPHGDLAWATAFVDDKTPSEPGKVAVKLEVTRASLQVPGPLSQYASVTQEELDLKLDNLVELERINEGIILHHVKQRYQTRKIYTFVGTILVAVNPYQSLPELYKSEMMEKARKRIMKGAEPIPHVYSIAATSLLDMCNFRGDQSVLISGESGSGKTETTKKLLQYLSNAAGSNQEGHKDVASAILDSNPVLEAFGNAKTLRNNNSSRFGKYMEVNYRRDDRKGGEIIGCTCISYLLEKSRVVHQTPGERNYHVFYMLLAGADSAMQDDLKLRPVGEFRYLNQSQCAEISGRNDTDEFAELTRSFRHVGFSDAQRLQILQTLAGILHLGNVQFEEVNDGSGSGVSAVTGETRRDLQLAARLLEMFNMNDTKGKVAGLEAGALALEKAMCFIMIRGATSTVKSAEGAVEIMERPLSPELAANNRDALAKAIYDKLFDRIVYQVNRSLYKSREEGWNIGVLDIFGFEVFEVNSFEQLCINYCNEKLQTFFNDIIFKGELKFLSDEGVQVDDITFQDNTGCVALIDAKVGGIFAHVADIAVNKQATDDDLAKKLVETFIEKESTKNVSFLRSKKRGAFAVKHFAGEVTYMTEGFIEKNKDKLPDALTSAMEASTLPILNDDEEAWNMWQPGADARKVYPHGVSGSGATTGGNKAAREPLATKFKKDLESLLERLRKTMPQFIRCIKPNEKQQHSLLEPVLTLNQLKYSGLFEAIRIRQSGYPLRMTHEQFLSRYKHCVLNVNQRDKATPKSYATALMELLCTKLTPPFPNLPDQPRNFAIGVTKVFIRKEAMGHALDECREANAGNLVIHIQRIIRGFMGKCRMYHIIGEEKQRQMQERKSEERERSLMELVMSACLGFNVQRRKEEAKEKAAREQIAEQKRLERERALQLKTKVARLLQRLFHMWRDGIKGRRIMAERALELALQADNGQCSSCFNVRPCAMHHTRSCNTSNLRKYLADALASKNPLMLQDAVRVADDCCTKPIARESKCAVLYVKPPGQEESSVRPLYAAKAYRPVLRPDPAALKEEEASANWDPALAALPPIHMLYADCCRELHRLRRDGGIPKGTLPKREGLHCDCRLILLKRAISRPAASCKVCRRGPLEGHKSVRDHRCIRSRAIAALQGNAKANILDTLKESYLRQALKDAIAVGSDLMLQDAVEKVDSCRMGAQLPSGLAGIYDQAKAALLEYSQVKTTLAALTSALMYASTVPRLVASVDSVKALVLEAREQGMGNELVVAEAVLRLAKVKNLLELRDRLRMAIEICSPSLMDSAMEQRAKLLPLFGSDLLAEETAGVTEMRRMVGYLRQIRDMTPEEEAKEREQDTFHTGDRGGAAGGDDDEGCAADRLLPRYVSRALEAVRGADPNNPIELKDAVESFATLVPNEAARTRYRRIFKWVVAYAPWKFERPSHGTSGEQPSSPSKQGLVEATVDKYGRKKFTGEGVGLAELKFFATRNTPGQTFGSPTAKLKGLHHM